MVECRCSKVVDMEKLIYELVEYGINTGLIEPADVAYRINVLAEMLGVDTFEESFEAFCESREIDDPEKFDDVADRAAEEGTSSDDWRPLADILNDICNEALASGLMTEDGITYRDLFDTKVMGAITPPPSVVQTAFNAHYKNSAKEATDYYYDFSKATNYIRTDRMIKDEKWVTETEYGAIDISINLAKPEKDPKAIAAAGQMKKGGYPACLLCRENEGYAGHVSHPARQNHRLIPITLDGQDYFLQYSPYVYYNEHCIVLNKNHIPMVINREVFTKLFDFVDLFPHYIIGSNADLPIVGGSILSHDHFQGGNYIFPMARAEYEYNFEMTKYPEVTAGIIKWPMSVIRLQSLNRQQIEEASNFILDSWREYSDESVGIRHFSFYNNDGPRELHNTITPIARKHDGKYEIDLVLRNNRTDEEHPWGIFHPSAELHHIKKENIGLIEVMGLAILPARLKKELAETEEIILGGIAKSTNAEIENKLRSNELTEKHADWVMEWLPKYGPSDLTPENIHKVVQDEVGLVFKKVLECAGVYKRDEKGQKAFRRFTESVSG